MSKCKYCGKEVENSNGICADCYSDHCDCEECECSSEEKSCRCSRDEYSDYYDYDDRMDNEYR
jgi:hypothetical protein